MSYLIAILCLIKKKLRSDLFVGIVIPTFIIVIHLLSFVSCANYIKGNIAEMHGLMFFLMVFIMVVNVICIIALVTGWENFVAGVNGILREYKEEVKKVKQRRNS